MFQVVNCFLIIYECISVSFVDHDFLTHTLVRSFIAIIIYLISILYLFLW